MVKNDSFKNKYSLQIRSSESKRIMEKYPDRRPIIVEKCINSNIDEIDKKKYLVPMDISIGKFIYVIRKRMKLTPEKAIYVFIKNVIPPSASLISSLYDSSADVDGFLYITFSAENTFG